MTLLRDALDRTLTEPQCARRWHALLAIWLETREPAARRTALDILARHADGDPRSAILRLTFLARTSGDSRFDFDERLDIEVSGPALLAACRLAADLARDRLTKSS